MPYPESTDLGIQIFGGLCTSIPPSDLPAGASPFCANVAFPEASVKTRDGLVSLGLTPAPTAGGFTTSFNGLANYGTPQLQNFLLAWDSLGDLYQIDQSGNLTLLNAAIGSPNLFLNSTSLFSRQFMAFSNTTNYTNPNVADFPRQWDGTNFDRVSQVGPGASPTVADGAFPAGFDIAASTGLNPLGVSTAIASISIVPGTGLAFVQLVGTGPQNSLLAVGDKIPISGNSVTGYNGTQTVVSANNSGFSFNSNPALGTGTGGTANLPLVVVNTATPLTTAQASLFTIGGNAQIAGATAPVYDGQWPIRDNPANGITGDLILAIPTTGLSTSGGGTVAPPSNITAGLRQVSVAFVTRQGYITKAAPPTNYTAAGGFLANVSNIPIGPSNVVARLLLFTLAIISPATTGTFFSIEENVVVNGITLSNAMLIQDNATTSITLNFRDSDLASGFNGEYLFTLIELGECSGVTSYNFRSVWTGERNRIRNVLNLSFNGGWNLGGGTGGSDVPLGWTSDAILGAGGSRVANGGIWLDAYQISGLTGSTRHGLITQPFFQDYLGVNIISPMTSYSIRVRAKVSSNTGMNGSLAFDLFSVSGGSLVSPVLIPLSQFKTTYTEVIAPYTPANLASIPADTEVGLSAALTTTGQSVTIDSFEVFPTLSPINTSIAWISYAFDPESFDATLSQVQIRPNDGQSLRTAFTIRGNLYLLKERYWATTVDDGINEPSSWNVSEVSNTIGASGPNAVDLGEEWAVVANRNGAYMFWGSDPIKLTQEIQEDASNTGQLCWNSTNWDHAETAWVLVDNQNKRVLIGLPVPGQDVVWSMDYKFAPSGEDVTPGSVYSVYMNKLIEHGGGMKWCPWSISAACAVLAERADGTQSVMLGSTPAGALHPNTPTIQVLTPGQLSDNGVAIGAVYQTYGQPDADEEQGLQLRAEQKLTDYLTGRAIGAGVMSIVGITGQRTYPIRGVNLSITPTNDFERNINVTGERIFWQVGTDAAGSWFQLEKFVAMQKQSPTVPVRGLG